jgi:hypothetical protein
MNEGRIKKQNHNSFNRLMRKVTKADEKNETRQMMDLVVKLMMEWRQF